MTTEKLQEKTTKTVPPPRLRFKQFEGAGEWEEKRLGEVAYVTMGSSPSSTAYNVTGNGLPLIQGNADIKNRLTLKRIYTSEVTKEGQPGDIILSVRAPVGTVARTNFLVCLGRGVAGIKSKSNQDFLYQILTFHENTWRGISQGGTFEAVTAQQVKDFTVFFPPLPEQQHIAATLSSLDDLITAHTDKLEALRQHKRGLMQGLFPAEGERVPRLRFPEFAGVGEWEEKKLGEIGTFRGGGTPSKTVPDYWSGDIPWVSSSDVVEDNIYKISKTRFVTEEAIKQSATKKIPSQTVLFVSRVGVGKIAVTDEIVCTSQDFINLTPEENNPYYLAYYFQARKNILISFGQGMAIKGFTKNDLESLVLPLPILPEQQRIADCLSSLDDLITAQADKIAALQEFKRGLMQGLFPSTTAAAQEAGK